MGGDESTLSQALVPRADETLRLPDGRALAFAEWGDPEGTPVLLFHGLPSSRLIFPDPETAAAMGVRAITIDRPGIGGSDAQPGHRIVDWPADVIAFADALGLDRFGVIGWSAGVSYALACAAVIPDRLSGVAATNSASAMIYLAGDDAEIRTRILDDEDQRILDIASNDTEAATREAISIGASWVEGVAEHPEQFLAGDHDEGDAWFFEDPARRDMFVDAVREGVRQGIEGFAVQWVAQLAPWGFRIEDISMPVHVWLGANDTITPPDVMARLTDRIPDHETHVWDDAGHNGIAKHLREVLTQVCGPGA